MKIFIFSFVLISCLLTELESTLGPRDRKSSSRSSAKVYKSSSSSSPETLENEQQVESDVVSNFPSTDSSSSSSFSQEMNVLERDLIQEEINPLAILSHHESFCSACSSTRQFQNPTLIFITPWNNRGYDLIKIFTKKFDYVVPVWFTVKRTGFEKYIVEGLHDIDVKWIETLRENHPEIRILPRVVFEKWPIANVHALFQSEDEKQQLAATLVQLLIDHAHLFDGLVLDLLIQFHDAAKTEVHHILRDITERVHQIQTNSTQKKEIFLIVPPVEKLFDGNDFQSLRDDLDGFCVMTFEFPSKEPAPVSPIGKKFMSCSTSLRTRSRKNNLTRFFMIDQLLRTSLIIFQVFIFLRIFRMGQRCNGSFSSIKERHFKQSLSRCQFLWLSTRSNASSNTRRTISVQQSSITWKRLC